MEVSNTLPIKLHINMPIHVCIENLPTTWLMLTCTCQGGRLIRGCCKRIRGVTLQTCSNQFSYRITFRIWPICNSYTHVPHASTTWIELHRSSHSIRVLLNPETHTNLPNLKINEGWNFYQVILSSWIHDHLPYLSRKLVHFLMCL